MLSALFCLSALFLPCFDLNMSLGDGGWVAVGTVISYFYSLSLLLPDHLRLATPWDRAFLQPYRMLLIYLLCVSTSLKDREQISWAFKIFQTLKTVESCLCVLGVAGTRLRLLAGSRCSVKANGTYWNLLQLTEEWTGEGRMEVMPQGGGAVICCRKCKPFRCFFSCCQPSGNKWNLLGW